jgi:LacI family transcriptional regulator
MGVAAFSLLLEEMTCHKERKPFLPRTVELKTTMIIRDSSLKI